MIVVITIVCKEFYTVMVINSTNGPKTKICVLTVTRPTDPKFFWTCDSKNTYFFLPYQQNEQSPLILHVTELIEHKNYGSIVQFLYS
jgi:nitrous oxide reductase accessory protein NosL